MLYQEDVSMLTFKESAGQKVCDEMCMFSVTKTEQNLKRVQLQLIFPQENSLLLNKRILSFIKTQKNEIPYIKGHYIKPSGQHRAWLGLLTS
jgi:hypothetical protein